MMSLLCQQATLQKIKSIHGMHGILLVTLTARPERIWKGESMAALQTLFGRVISSKIPLAVPSQLSHIEQFGAGHGKVLIYSKKPRRFLPHKNEDLKFTGWSLSGLLEESSFSELKITVATSHEFEANNDDPVKLTVELSKTPAVQKALEDLELDVGESKQATISANLGKVTNIQTSLLHSVSQKKLKVKLDHPTVQEAIATGGVLFVTTSVYEGERCHLHVSVGDSQKEVFSRDKPTAVAYLLLKLTIDRHGLLQPKRNDGFLCVLETPPSNSQASADPDPSSFIRSEIHRFHSRESLEVKGWIVVDVISPGEIPEDGEQQEEPAPVPETPIPQSDSTQPPESEPVKFVVQSSEEESKVSGEPVPVKEEVMVQETATLSSQPEEPMVDSASNQSVPVKEEVMVQETATLSSQPEGPMVDAASGQPVSVVEEVMVQETADLMSQPGGAFEEPTPQLDEHYLYSLKDFQPFESDTYDGLYGEVQDWVKPLVTNKKLHTTYLSYVTPPKTAEKLKKLSQFLQAYGNAHRAHKSTPAVTYAPMEPVMAALDSEWSVQLDEVSSMIVVSEALAEFPQHIVKKAIELSSEKRTTLVDFIRSTPFGVHKHVYTDEGPFRDPELNPFMTRMGFSIPPHSKTLVLDLGHEENEDRLAAGLILMVSTLQQ